MVAVRLRHFHSHDWINCERLGNCSNIELGRIQSRVRCQRRRCHHFDLKLAGAVDEHSADYCDSIVHFEQQLRRPQPLHDMVTLAMVMIAAVAIVVDVVAWMHYCRPNAVQSSENSPVVRTVHAVKMAIDLDR